RNRRVDLRLNRRWIRPGLTQLGPGGGPLSPTSVQWAQSCLNRLLGTRIAARGVMGPDTRRALQLFQQRHRIPGQGLLNLPTMARLGMLGAVTPPLQVVQQTADLWATADSTCNVLFHPDFRRERPGPIREGTLAALQGGLVTDTQLRPRVSVIIGPGT